MVNNPRLGRLLGVVLTASFQLQVSAKSEDASVFGQNPVVQEATRDDKNSIVQSENAGEHQDWLLHVQGTEIFQGQPGGFNSPYRGTNSLAPGDNFRVPVFIWTNQNWLNHASE